MSDSENKSASGLEQRVEAEVERLKGLYKSLEPVSGLERDYMMRLKRQWELIEELQAYYRAVDEACVVSHIGTAESFESPKHALNALGVWSEGVGAHFANEQIEELTEKLRKIHNAALPDPNDERDISLDWLVKLILEETKCLHR